jgi:SAM-dependent methyltransferase
MRRCIECAARFEGTRNWACPTCGFSPRSLGSVLSFCDPLGADGFEPEAFDRLALLEQASFWFRSRNDLLIWSMRRYFPRAQSLLEIGCGTGFVLNGLDMALPELRVAGAELHAAGLQYASRRLAGVDLFQFDARSIPFAEEFDVIGAFDVLEHIDEDEQVLAEMRAAVRPGGGVLVTVPQHPWLWSASDDYAKHQRRYRRSELLRKVTAAGFTVRRITSFVSLLLPAMIASRMGSWMTSRAYDPGAEHAAAQRASKLLEHIGTFERSLITRGVDLPVGGSLLLVASRP